MKCIPLLAAAAISSLVLVGCGDDSSPESTPDTTTPVVTDPTLPPTTDTPATEAPATDATTTVPPTSQPDLPPRPVVIDDGAFGSVAELGAAADTVVLATVTGEESLGRPGVADDPSADEFVGLTLSVDSIFTGVSAVEIKLGWDAYAVDAGGMRVAENVLNGVPVPHVGDQLVLFLRHADPQFTEFLDGFPSDAPVGLDGVGFVVDGKVTITDTSSTETDVLMGLTVDQIASML